MRRFLVSAAALALGVGVGAGPALAEDAVAPGDYGDTNPVDARDRGDYPGLERGTDETFNANNEFTNEVIDRHEALDLNAQEPTVTGEDFDEFRRNLGEANVEGEMLSD
ncbi:hypothetical protein C882_0902 [Caenispirillum salinarum AK4]|uniref:Uncharacterized protein n=1 Tax=Caenispirillum salinarum AK4 TaxID=1238182 RepID=K9GRW5_9PROT|nr:hypothetical protein [Caenispirillum salinarum]EKV28690.1 hypothetical protein C882_0902 [Caenispirillum salinarum AK4]